MVVLSVFLLLVTCLSGIKRQAVHYAPRLLTGMLQLMLDLRLGGGGNKKSQQFPCYPAETLCAVLANVAVCGAKELTNHNTVVLSPCSGL